MQNRATSHLYKRVCVLYYNNILHRNTCGQQQQQHLPYGLHASILPLSNIEKSHTIHFTIPHSIASIENRNGTIMYSTKPLGEGDKKKRASHSHLITYAVFILLFSHDIWFVYFFCLFYIYKDIYAKAFERKITFCTYDITRMQPSCVTHTLNLRTLHMFVCAASVICWFDMCFWLRFVQFNHKTNRRSEEKNIRQIQNKI